MDEDEDYPQDDHGDDYDDEGYDEDYDYDDEDNGHCSCYLCEQEKV